MTMIDSRKASVGLDTSPYVTSEPSDTEWGQPAASRYVFLIDGGRLHGHPIEGVCLPCSETTSLDEDMAEELQAWDAASDEAFWNFEATFD